MSINTYIPREKRGRVYDIIREEAEAIEITAQALLERSRYKAHDRARAKAMWRARRETRLSYPQIAAIFERDHTAVRNACLKLEEEFLQSGLED